MMRYHGRCGIPIICVLATVRVCAGEPGGPSAGPGAGPSIGGAGRDATAPRAPSDWPQWRGGPQRSGAVAEAPIFADLAAGANLVEAWRSEPLPHGYGEQNGQVVGQGSPVVCQGKVYLYVNWPDPASVRPGRFKLPDRVTDTVLCLDLVSGKTLWKTDLPGRSWRWGCSATLAVAAGKVVALGSAGDGFCLDAATGEEVWRWRNPGVKGAEGERYTNVIGSFQSSALVHDGLAVITTRDRNGLIVLDLAKGGEHWPNDALRRVAGSWSSPSAWIHDGGWTLIDRGRGFDPASGRIQWKGLEHGWSTPAVEGNRCAVMGGKGLRLYRLTAARPELVAEVPLDNGSGCPAIHQGRVYARGARAAAAAGAMSEPAPALAAGKPETCPETNPAPVGKVAKVGVVLCADAAGGKVLWETPVADQPLGGGQWSFASPMVGSGVVCVLANRLLLFSAENGKRLGNPSLQVPVLKCTSLAVAGDCLIARDSKALVCYKAAKH